MTSRAQARWAARILALLALIVTSAAWARDPCRVCRMSVSLADGGESMAATYVRPPHGVGPAERIIVLLHGLGGDASSWLQVHEVRDRLDAAMAKGELPPTTLLIPDGGDGYWADWQGGKRHYAALVVRLVEALQRQMPPARGSPRRHAIVGASMGGFGALSIGMQHPALFEVVVALSGTDLEIAATAAPKRKVYLDVLGRAPWTKALERLNPLQLVRQGAGKGQAFWIGWGSAEAAKFAEGGRLLVAEMQTAGLQVESRVVEGGVHGWESTWSALHPWWLGGLLETWRSAAPGTATTAVPAHSLAVAPTRTTR